jgi:hypothetical protein
MYSKQFNDIMFSDKREDIIPETANSSLMLQMSITVKYDIRV